MLKRTIAVILTIVLVIGCGVLSVSADRQSDLQSEINALEKQSQKLEAQIKDLKAQNASQKKIANAIQAKIDNVQGQINACNAEINKINQSIAANKEEINKCNEKIDDNKKEFQKRLRAIYMNNTDSSLQILLGAEDFSNFLQLEQMTSSMAAHDKRIINDLIGDIEELNKKQAENDELLKQQVAIKSTIAEKRQVLEAEQNEVDKIIRGIQAETDEISKDNAAIEKELRLARQELNNYLMGLKPSSNLTYNEKGFCWPTPGYYQLSQGYKGSAHTGIDIAGGGMYGKPIVAVADGQVLVAKSGMGRNPNATGLASYGNYVVIDHGTDSKGNYIMTYSAHMSGVSVSVGQHVKQGQVIGYVGNSGRTFGATGTHLHFEFRINGQHKNPMNYVG